MSQEAAQDEDAWFFGTLSQAADDLRATRRGGADVDAEVTNEWLTVLVDAFSFKKPRAPTKHKFLTKCMRDFERFRLDRHVYVVATMAPTFRVLATVRLYESVVMNQREFVGVGDVATRAEYRGKGLAQKLFGKIFQDWESRNPVWVLHSSLASARALYRKLGFHPTRSVGFIELALNSQQRDTSLSAVELLIEGLVIRNVEASDVSSLAVLHHKSASDAYERTPLYWRQWVVPSWEDLVRNDLGFQKCVQLPNRSEILAYMTFVQRAHPDTGERVLFLDEFVYVDERSWFALEIILKQILKDAPNNIRLVVREALWRQSSEMREWFEGRATEESLTDVGWMVKDSRATEEEIHQERVEPPFVDYF